MAHRPIEWRLRAFDELTHVELYECLRLRQMVFVVEQNCPYLDADGRDDRALHLMGWSVEETRDTAESAEHASGGHVAGSSSVHASAAGEHSPPGPATRLLVAYARLFAPGAAHDEAAIGRVVVHHDARGEGLGRALMNEAMACVEEKFGAGPIRLSAQRYLESFYTSLGFAIAGSPYDEDGIPHVAMLRE